MKVEIKVPLMGESISQVTIGTILKPAGAIVKVDDEILELETDKLNQVLYAQETGLLTLSVKQGDSAAVGQVIGSIEVKTESEPAIKPVEKKPAPKEEKPVRMQKEQWLEELTPAVPTKNKTKPQDGAKDVSPGQGRPGRGNAALGKDEFAGTAELTPPMSLPVEKTKESRSETRKKLSSLRKVLAQRLLEAQKQTVQLTTFNEADMSEVIKLREQYKELFMTKHGVKLGFMSFFVKAAVFALKNFPIVNAYLEGDEIVYRNSIDIGIAISTERGLIVPVLRDCEALSFADIEKRIEDFATRAKNGRLSVDELQGGGFTITNGGVFGSLLSTPILNPPQCAILGMHKISKRAIVVSDEIVIRSMMYLALSYDHRLLDGKEAVSFLVLIKNCIEDPHRLELGV